MGARHPAARVRHAAAAVDFAGRVRLGVGPPPRAGRAPRCTPPRHSSSLNGFYILSPDEVGVIERFGRKVLPYREPGPHYKLPWPIETLTRIQARKVRTVEIGFRSNSTTPDTEPAAYEWNVQHRSGRFQRKPEESLMLTGDQNMIELNATVHYNLRQAGRFPVPPV